MSIEILASVITFLTTIIAIGIAGGILRNKVSNLEYNMKTDREEHKHIQEQLPVMQYQIKANEQKILDTEKEIHEVKTEHTDFKLTLREIQTDLKYLVEQFKTIVK